MTGEARVGDEGGSGLPPQVLGGAATHWLVDVSQLGPEERLGLANGMAEAGAPIVGALSLGSTVTVVETSEAEPTGRVLATYDDLRAYIDPDGTGGAAQGVATAIWRNLHHRTSWLRERHEAGVLPPALFESESRERELMLQLFADLPGSNKQAVDLQVLYQLLVPQPEDGLPLASSIRNINLGKVRTLASFVNTTLGLTGDARLPIYEHVRPTVGGTRPRLHYD